MDPTGKFNFSYLNQEYFLNLFEIYFHYYSKKMFHTNEVDSAT